MPKLPRTTEEVESIKTAILTTALKLMCDDGFESLSMRKLAGRLKMTAANIYNYYRNKDDLYLSIQTRGFQMLADRLQEIYNSETPGPQKLLAMMRAYLAFGTEYPDYYEIMFSRNTPKYTDYKGTPMEPAATVEKQTALKAAEIAVRAIRGLYDGKAEVSESEALYRTVLVWCALHGVVNLLNSRVLPEVVKTGAALRDRMFQDLLTLAVGEENTQTQK